MQRNKAPKRAGSPDPMSAAAAAQSPPQPPPPPPPLPEPGEIVFYDYRPAGDRQEAGAAATTSTSESDAEKAGAATTTPAWRARADRRALRLAQFNVERGYELARVIEELRRLDADVIALQEVDVGCDRSGGQDVGRAVARALGFCGFFLCEFFEHRSPMRDARSQGGGAHGNAVLSRYDLRHARRVDHARHPVDWDLPPERQPHALARREPRTGRRAALAVRVFPPWLVGGGGRQVKGGGEGGEGDDGQRQQEEHELDGVLVYSLHLEVFCGAADRAAQFADVVADARRERRRERRRELLAPSVRAAAASPQPPRHAVLGDLNTMAHGVARLSPHYAQGRLRWRTLGLTEAEWWERHVLWRRRREEGRGGEGDEEQDDDGDQEEEEDDNDGGSPAAAVVAARRQQLERWGVPAEAARALLPNPGFACPFPARGTVTLDNPAYRLPLPPWAARALGPAIGARWEEEDDDDDEEEAGAPPTTTTANPPRLRSRRRRRAWIPLMAGKLDWVLLHERGFAVERAFLGNSSFGASDHAWLAVDVVVR